MPLIQHFEDIKGWQEARTLVKGVYQITNVAPFSKDFGLVNQIQRASVSVMANIAEGFDCDSPLEFSRFLGIARRSIVEVQSLLYVALDANYVSAEVFQELYQQANKTKGLVGALKYSLKNARK